MMGTKGQFAINSRWDFGWDVLLQTDKNFSRTYAIENFNDSVHRSSIYLTGLNGRNYFDVRAMRFEVQERHSLTIRPHLPASSPGCCPRSTTPTSPTWRWAAGSCRSMSTRRPSAATSWIRSLPIRTTMRPFNRVRGIDGQSGRLTAEAEWKRTFTTDGGLLLTPLLALRGDAGYLNASSGSLNAINQMASNLGVDDDMRSSLARFMATAGLEMRWPVLFSSTSTSHIFEPMAQVFVRPNEQYVGGLDCPQRGRAELRL